jgi:hypothetical protein
LPARVKGVVEIVSVELTEPIFVAVTLTGAKRNEGPLRVTGFQVPVRVTVLLKLLIPVILTVVEFVFPARIVRVEDPDVTLKSTMLTLTRIWWTTPPDVALMVTT